MPQPYLRNVIEMHIYNIVIQDSFSCHSFTCLLFALGLHDKFLSIYLDIARTTTRTSCGDAVPRRLVAVAGVENSRELSPSPSTSNCAGAGCYSISFCNPSRPNKDCARLRFSNRFLHPRAGPNQKGRVLSKWAPSSTSCGSCPPVQKWARSCSPRWSGGSIGAIYLTRRVSAIYASLLMTGR